MILSQSITSFIVKDFPFFIVKDSMRVCKCRCGNKTKHVRNTDLKKKVAEGIFKKIRRSDLTENAKLSHMEDDPMRGCHCAQRIAKGEELAAITRTPPQ
jgi:hypothetical protein